MLNGNAIKIINRMDQKDNFSEFKIRSLVGTTNIVNATIYLWTEEKENPTITDYVTRETYTLNGTNQLYIIEYKDEQNNYLKIESERVSISFYSIRKLLENKNIKLLIKGARFDCYMIPRLQCSIKAQPLTLGKRTSFSDDLVGIFDKEEDVSKIVNVDEQIKYYYQWAESIKGIPY
ncbi:hypothetical protein CAPN006_21490 [Capnocytophaga canimorsus]|nr:hypothetical protein CAPN006_21490 [Capnocytophaga canimorsus]